MVPKWFKVTIWPFNWRSPVQPFKGSRFHSPSKEGHNRRIARYIILSQVSCQNSVETSQPLAIFPPFWGLWNSRDQPFFSFFFPISYLFFLGGFWPSPEFGTSSCQSLDGDFLFKVVFFQGWKTGGRFITILRGRKCLSLVHPHHGRHRKSTRI